MERHIDSWHRLWALKPSVIFTFGYGGVSHSPDKTLPWAEEDVRAVERICREGMKRKTGSDGMARRVQEYYDQVGAMTPAEAGRRMRLEAQRQEYWQEAGARGRRSAYAPILRDRTLAWRCPNKA